MRGGTCESAEYATTLSLFHAEPMLLLCWRTHEVWHCVVRVLAVDVRRGEEWGQGWLLVGF